MNDRAIGPTEAILSPLYQQVGEDSSRYISSDDLVQACTNIVDLVRGLSSDISSLQSSVSALQSSMSGASTSLSDLDVEVVKVRNDMTDGDATVQASCDALASAVAMANTELSTVRGRADQTVIVTRTPATGRWLVQTPDGGSLEMGDTGWRSITVPDPAAAFASITCWVRRIGNMIHVRADAHVGTGTLYGKTFAEGRVDIPLPSGFHRETYSSLPGAFRNDGVPMSAHSAAYLHTLTLSGFVALSSVSNWHSSHRIGFEGRWPATGAWPSTLPGTAHSQPLLQPEEHATQQSDGTGDAGE